MWFWRIVLLAALSFGTSTTASAQMNPWGGWSERGPWGDGPPYSSPRRGNRQAEPPPGYFFDPWGSPYGMPRQRPRGPRELSGGPRPEIDMKAPSIVEFASSYDAGTIIIDTNGRKLYYVLSATSAYAYPISVGREGFTWAGTEKISRKTPWPDWFPPEEMRDRDPKLPEKMTGGLRNPLGAMALYLGNTLYRIHGTNDVKSIGRAASSGCFRMMNEHVMHLSSLADIGATVIVVNKLPGGIVAVKQGSS